MKKCQDNPGKERDMFFSSSFSLPNPGAAGIKGWNREEITQRRSHGPSSRLYSGNGWQHMKP